MAVKERSTARLRMGFRNTQQRLQVPNAVTYRIDDEATGLNIRPWTAVDPAQEVDVILTPTDNRMLGDGETERRIVTAVATYGGSDDDQVIGDMGYTISRARFAGS